MAYGYGNELPMETMPALDEFTNVAMQDYEPDMEALRQDAARELEGEIVGQGLQGRQAGYQRAALGQQLDDEADRFRSGLGLKRAELGETLRRRGLSRTWQIEDRDARLAALRKQAEAKRAEADREARGGFLQQLFGGVGRVGGAIAGGVYGGPVGAAVGSEAGGAIGGALGDVF